jgi:PAS domain S-box-containing protein
LAFGMALWTYRRQAVARMQERAARELQRLNRALRTLSECNQAMVRALDEAELVQSVCRILVEEGGYRMAWVGYAQQDEARSVLPVAAAGVEEGYLETIHTTWADDVRGSGPTGQAIRTGQPALTRNIPANPEFAPWREEALRRGYSSSIGLPLIEGGRPFGALMLYSQTAGAFDAEEVRLLSELAHDLSYGVQALRTRAERERVEAALRESETRYRILVENIPQKIFMKSRDHRWVSINENFARDLGVPPEEVIGKLDYDLYPKDLADKYRADDRRIMETGETDEFDEEYPLGGERRIVHTIKTPVRDENGAVTGVLGVFWDVTNTKRAEEALRQANAYNRNLIEASLDPLVTISPDGKITDVNTATEKVTGGLRTELIGTDFSDYFTDPEKARAGYQQVFREGSVQDYALEIRHRDGHTTPVLYNAALYRDEHGEAAGILAAARDITARRKAEEEVRKLNESLEQRVRDRTAELEAANKELEAFTYSVSHDLRAPLRHVDGFSKLLVEDFGPRIPEEARHYLDRIQAGTRQMGQLVDDLLNLSRIGRREPSLQITGLNSLVEEVIAELKTENPGRRIQWKIASLPFVECDPMLMKQVLVNLLSNAVKFTRPREETVIEVGTQKREGHDEIFVRDNGVGFSMKFADKLFGVFQRLHRAEDFEGTGVGLATVQRIIHKHHGEVWAESELGRGATFCFTLGTERSTRAISKGEAA